MVGRCLIGAVTLSAVLGATLAAAPAQDGSKYPDLKGQWVRADSSPGAPWDPGKPAGLGQQAPLTAEYQAQFEATLARRAEGVNPTPCIPPGMPRAMIAYEPMEIIVMADTTYIVLTYMSEFRRIFTDGRNFTDDIEPSYAGYSIGRWEDTDGDGRFDTLVIETRGLKGPRTFDESGIPLHQDNLTVVKERIRLDRSDSGLLHNEITTIDNALTRPWTVTRSYRRAHDAEWDEHLCAENHRYVTLGSETYAIGEDGNLAPIRKDQPPPDLRYFQNRR
jgi:hypothetical protein